MTAVARIVSVGTTAVLVWLALDLLLLLVAGILVAVLLRTLATALASKTGMRIGWALATVVAAILGTAVAAAVLYAPALAEQADEMTRTVPAAMSELTSWVRQYGWGTWLLDQVFGGDGGGLAAEQAGRVASSFVYGVVGAVIVAFIGLYLAADPVTYLRGVIRLVPRARRRRAAEVMFATGHTLRWWLLGQAVSMTIVGIAMGAGLAIIGVPLSFALGVLAGLFEFVPLVGPVLALGPALLLAAAEDPQLALYVLALYAVVQTGESYVVTPLVQRRVVHLPPVVTIAAQVGWSWLAGPLGLLLAVPITAASLVAVQMLYVEDVLHGRIDVDAEEVARRQLREADYLRGLIPDERTRAA